MRAGWEIMLLRECDTCVKITLICGKVYFYGRTSLGVTLVVDTQCQNVIYISMYNDTIPTTFW